MKKYKILFINLLLCIFAISGCSKKAPDPVDLLKTAFSKDIDSLDYNMQCFLDYDIEFEEGAFEFGLEADINVKHTEEISHYAGSIGANNSTKNTNKSSSKDINAYVVNGLTTSTLYLYDSELYFWDNAELESGDILNKIFLNLNDKYTYAFNNINYIESNNEDVYTISAVMHLDDLIELLESNNELNENFEKDLIISTEGVRFNVIFDIDKKTEQLKYIEFNLDPDTLNNEDNEINSYINLYFTFNINEINNINIDLPEEIMNI